VRIYAGWCEQDQSLDLAKHLHCSVAGTHASFPLVSHFVGFTFCCACGVVLLGQMESACALLGERNTERSGVRAGLVKVTYTERQALTLPKGLTFPSDCQLASWTVFHTVLHCVPRQTHPPHLKRKEASSYICAASGFCLNAALAHMQI